MNFFTMSNTKPATAANRRSHITSKTLAISDAVIALQRFVRARNALVQLEAFGIAFFFLFTMKLQRYPKIPCNPFCASSLRPHLF
jgi:hypothetical protein